MLNLLLPLYAHAIYLDQHMIVNTAEGGKNILDLDLGLFHHF